MPLVSLPLVITVLSSLLLGSSSQAASGLLSWRCSWTQKPRVGSAVMALGQPAGERKSLVVFALRRGGSLGGAASPVRPRSSCARAAVAVKLNPAAMNSRFDRAMMSSLTCAILVRHRAQDDPR